MDTQHDKIHLCPFRAFVSPRVDSPALDDRVAFSERHPLAVIELENHRAFCDDPIVDGDGAVKRLAYIYHASATR
jgi:hypothetical protein